MKKVFLLNIVATQLAGILLMSLISGNSFAEIYRCTDGVTGETVFTDTQCPDSKSGDLVQVGRTNFDSSYALQKQSGEPQQDPKSENISGKKHDEFTANNDSDATSLYKAK